MLEKIIKQLKSMGNEVSMIKTGYNFGKYLAKDVHDRSSLAANNISDILNDISIVMQLGEYQMAWADIRGGEANPYSLGVVLYGLTHSKEDKMMDEFWYHLKQKEYEAHSQF